MWSTGEKKRRGEKDGERLYHHEWDGEERPINKMNLFALSRREIQFDMPDWARWATHFFFLLSQFLFAPLFWLLFGRSQGSQPPHLHLNGFRSIRAISMQQLDGLVWSEPLLLVVVPYVPNVRVPPILLKSVSGWFASSSRTESNAHASFPIISKSHHQ